jgi:hypothetical protein
VQIKYCYYCGKKVKMGVLITVSRGRVVNAHATCVEKRNKKLAKKCKPSYT